VQVRRVPRSHGILERIMQLAEGIPGWNVECAFDDGVGGTDEGEVETHPVLTSLTTIYRLRLRASTAGTPKFALIRVHHRRATSLV
jgi:hypothetical protein